MAEKVIIIGSGPAGLSAAIYTAREGFEPLVISGYNAGGQLILTTLVENIPGFPQGVMGSDYIKLLMEQAKKFGARFVDDDATKVDLSKRPFTVFVGDKAYETQSIIIATGSSPRWLGIASEKQFIGRGVSICATCDAAFFKGKNVMIVGGGDTAMEDSLFLTRFVGSVTVVHRRDSLRASKIMQERAFANPKIKFMWNSEIVEIKGESKVSSAIIRNILTNETQEMKTDGVFVAIGYVPNAGLFKDRLKLDDQGYILTKDEVKTDIEGVFVAGDVSDRKYRQAAVASGSGIKAALETRAYLMDFMNGERKS
jgi:thioredoxin reductase (NADPH)